MKHFITICISIILFGCNSQYSGNIDDVIKHSEKQLKFALKNIEPLLTKDKVFPRTLENEKIKLVSSKDWTSGFFGGNLWMMYELTGKDQWKKRALNYTLPLEDEQWNANDHDIGFKMYCSFGHAIKYVDNPEYKEILIQSAKTLSTRYNPVVGCIRSWNSNPKTAHWKYPVIIDNMMNLELLMWAAKETGNESFREIAVKHAQTTAKNHFRDDYSCYHVIDYDPETGEVLNKNTHQGAADNSDWARGQAWAVYGFTMMYRETGMEEFLGQAKHIADYLLTVDGMKEGKVPYWDFKAPEIPNEPYDASAAAIISSALFELYEFTNNEAYLNTAQKLLATLVTPEFFAKSGENGGFLLLHSTGSKPYDSEVDVPLNYADYYFLESIIKSKKYGENLMIALSKD
ncbi:glycoside hydrolase family 88 protein [uncultured Draconibacterium sp.]|uniref:glycoside hydrolase family 88 protein n=1 Tax=uncultured Draconibacterium sp. TaxID=1573823 RepID=UPI002AA947D3|nr:glycoside hydrolase family 88 protein [uncultured Draconibacterium sp.]